jgi:hypothetical protein
MKLTSQMPSSTSFIPSLWPTYDTVINHNAAAAIVVPPRANAVEPINDRPPGQRDQHIAAISRDGRMKWQVSNGYGKRSLVETAIGRYPSIIGSRLRARLLPAQQTEAAIGCAVVNRMLACARPKSVRRKEVAAKYAPSKIGYRSTSDPCTSACDWGNLKRGYSGSGSAR